MKYATVKTPVRERIRFPVAKHNIVRRFSAKVNIVFFRLTSAACNTRNSNVTVILGNYCNKKKKKKLIVYL